MSILITKDIGRVNRDELNALYGNTGDAYSLFADSFVKVFAIDEGKLAGAVRFISEGVETILLVDLKTADPYGEEVKTALVKEAEKEINDRRVMVYGSREDTELYEDLGYGRCKNAWTYFKEGMKESDFLPSGYRFENEFLSSQVPFFSVPKDTVKKAPSMEITYRIGFEDTSFEDINAVLTKAFGGRPHDVNRTKEAFANSRYSVTAYDGKKLVGVARAVSDGKKFATILNVAVDPEYQGLSIGKKIVLKLSELIEAEVIVLNTHPGAVGFYNKLREYRRNKYVFEKFIRNEEPEKRPENDKRPTDWTSAMFTPKGYRFPDEYDLK